MPVGHVPVLPGARVPGTVPAGPRGNIGGLLPVISPSPAASAPSQVRQLTFGRDDSVAIGLEPVARRSGTAVLLAIAAAAAVAVAATGGWLAVTGRMRRRRTRGRIQ